MQNNKFIRSLIISFSLVFFSTTMCVENTSTQAPQKPGIGDRILHAAKDNAASRALTKMVDTCKAFKDRFVENYRLPLLAWRYRKGQLKTCDIKQSQLLEKQARALAAKMGDKNSNVHVFLSTELPCWEFCTLIGYLSGIGPKTIFLDKKHWEILSKEEQDYILAHETAHATEPWYAQLCAALRLSPLLTWLLVIDPYAVKPLVSLEVAAARHIPGLSRNTKIYGINALNMGLVGLYYWNMLKVVDKVSAAISRRAEKRADLLAVKTLGTAIGGIEYLSRELDDPITAETIKLKELSIKSPKAGQEIKQTTDNLLKKLAGVAISDWEKNSTHPPDAERVAYLTKWEQTKSLQPQTAQAA